MTENCTERTILLHLPLCLSGAALPSSTLRLGPAKAIGSRPLPRLQWPVGPSLSGPSSGHRSRVGGNSAADEEEHPKSRGFNKPQVSLQAHNIFMAQLQLENLEQPTLASCSFVLVLCHRKTTVVFLFILNPFFSPK